MDHIEWHHAQEPAHDAPPAEMDVDEEDEAEEVTKRLKALHV